MKTKAILATLLIAAAASADARFTWPYPRKAVSPDEIGHWVVINSDAWTAAAKTRLIRSSKDKESLQSESGQRGRRRESLFYWLGPICSLPARSCWNPESWRIGSHTGSIFSC